MDDTRLQKRIVNVDGYLESVADCRRKTNRALTVVGLFAGIGGLEEGFRRAGYQSLLLCELDEVARKVLKDKFSKTELATDICELNSIPICKVVTAGFPCQDLSQVGERKGIDGPNSRLVEQVFKLLKNHSSQLEWLVLENVPFMLRLDGGRAIRTITKALEGMGWQWAYRTIDSRAFGLPQRRRRVIVVASPIFDPRPVLFGENEGPPAARSRGSHACGFYWTEGNSGIGWAENAIPPLKGGSGLNIPSPPAIWFPRRRAIVTPDIRDAERLQGFNEDWTISARDHKHGDRKRWKLVGNAVSVPLAEWLAGRLTSNELYNSDGDSELPKKAKWPDAAWGTAGKRFCVGTTEWPVRRQSPHLAEFLHFPTTPLSHRAASGFLSRLESSGLKFEKAFAADLHNHLKRGKTLTKGTSGHGNQSPKSKRAIRASHT